MAVRELLRCRRREWALPETSFMIKSRRLVLDGSRAVVVMSAICFPKEIGAFLTVVAHVESL